MEEATFPPGEFQYRDQEDERDRKMYGQKMEATDKLRPVSALKSVWRKRDEQGGQEQNWRKSEKPKANPNGNLASQKCHAVRCPRESKELHPAG